jgi:hypothetical protein
MHERIVFSVVKQDLVHVDYTVAFLPVAVPRLDLERDSARGGLLR